MKAKDAFVLIHPEKSITWARDLSLGQCVWSFMQQDTRLLAGILL